MDTQNIRTEISQLGEFGLIERLSRSIEIRQNSTVLGIGDDAAVLKAEHDRVLVSTDILVEGTHFDLTYMPLRHLGYKAAIVNFSDIIAMNGTPRQIVVGIAMSNRFPVEAIEELYDGLRLACKNYEVDLVGGDTVSHPHGLTLSITVIGHAKADAIVTRSQAKEHDLLCVTGDLGAAYAGLLLLEREKAEFMVNPQMQPDLQGFDYVLQRQLKPEARLDMLEKFKDWGIQPTAMIDLSDGLASDLIQLCQSSKLGCHLYEEKLPIDPQTCSVADSFNILPTVAALNGGEDYELLFTIPPSLYDRLKGSQDVTVIGHMCDPNEGVMLVPQNGPLMPITAQGWKHFQN